LYAEGGRLSSVESWQVSLSALTNRTDGSKRTVDCLESRPMLLIEEI